MKTSYDVILHVPSLRGGGAERVAVEVARYFASQGKETAFFLHDEERAFDLPVGVDVIVSRRGHLRRVTDFRALLHQTKPSAVVSFLPYANLISLLANAGRATPARMVVSEHQSYAKTGPLRIRDHLKAFLAAHLYRMSDVIVAVSNGVAMDMRERISIAAARKIVVINNPCFIEGAFDTRVPRDASMLTVLAVGRLTPLKGFDSLIKAFSHVRETLTTVQLVIVGEGEERRKLETLVARLGLSESVKLPGFTQDVAEQYRRADLFVCSSRSEGFGNVIVEALSFGLPVVSTACPHGPAEVLEGGRYGTLVPVGDVAALAGAMVEALGMPVDGQTQVGRAKYFSLERIGAQYSNAAGLAP